MPREESMAMEKKAEKTVLMKKVLALALVLVMLAISLTTLISEKPEIVDSGVKLVEHSGDRYVYELGLKFDKEMSSTAAVVSCLDDEGNEYAGEFNFDKDYRDGSGTCMVLQLETNFPVKPENWRYTIQSAISLEQDGKMGLFLLICLPLSLVATLTFIGTLAIGIKTCWHNGNHVMVYNGVTRHELTINGVCVDKKKGFFPKYLELSAVFENDIYVASVKRFNQTDLFVNGIPQASDDNQKKEQETPVDGGI